MSDSAPFFKFNSQKWLAGTIRTYSLEAQGAFINAAAIVWRDSGLFKGTLADLAAKIDPYGCRREPGRTEHIVALLNELVDGGLVQTELVGYVRIKFLDEELRAVDEFRARQSRNAQRRWSGRAVGSALASDKAAAHLPPRDRATAAYTAAKDYMAKRLAKANKAPSTATLDAIKKDLYSQFGRHCLPGRDRDAVTEGMEAALARWGSANAR